MITYLELTKNPRVFKSLTGVTVSEFGELFNKVQPLWLNNEIERLSRRERKRAIGGGRDYALTLKERLLMTLVWLKLYLTVDALGFFFGVSGSTASRNTRNILPVLRQLGDETLGWPEAPKRGQGKNIEQALQEYPDLLAIIDEEKTAKNFFKLKIQPLDVLGNFAYDKVLITKIDTSGDSLNKLLEYGVKKEDIVTYQ